MRSPILEEEILYRRLSVSEGMFHSRISPRCCSQLYLLYSVPYQVLRLNRLVEIRPLERGHVPVPKKLRSDIGGLWETGAWVHGYDFTEIWFRARIVEYSRAIVECTHKEVIVVALLRSGYDLTA